MTTTENSMSLETTQTEAKPHLPGGIKFDWTATILCTLLIGGVYLDGWAHAHGKVDSTCFTPWHAVLYSGFAFLTEYAHPQVSTWVARDVHASSNLPGDMYVMNADGSLQTRLISSSYNHVNPAWSHNGRRIAFSAGSNSKGSNLQIYVANADGSGQIRLTNDTFDEWEPAWSPDDRKIIFTSNRDGNYELYVMNADGSGQIRLTDGPAFNGIASWSPDGHKIVFISERDGNDEAYVMNADGSS